jgi:hypothetical protein
MICGQDVCYLRVMNHVPSVTEDSSLLDMVQTGSKDMAQTGSKDMASHLQKFYEKIQVK